MVAKNAIQNKEEDLKAEVEKLKLMISKLMEEKDSSKNEYENDNYDKDDFNGIRIMQEEYIKVMSLCPMELNLSTEGNGKGKKFKFDKFGDVKRILYSDLVNIMENNSHFLNYGFFYILDSKVIRKHGLDETYEKILTKEKIERIVNNSVDAVDLFKSANEKQREFIQDMLIARVRDDIDVDLNMVDRISRIAGINIAERGEESKAYSQQLSVPA